MGVGMVRPRAPPLAGIQPEIRSGRRSPDAPGECREDRRRADTVTGERQETGPRDADRLRHVGPTRDVANRTTGGGPTRGGARASRRTRVTCAAGDLSRVWRTAALVAPP